MCPRHRQLCSANAGGVLGSPNFSKYIGIVQDAQCILTVLQKLLTLVSKAELARQADEQFVLLRYADGGQT
ncbi:hypothetical protein R0K04_30580, partial [Pseudoalteromonas sp. SIMBA_153]